MTEQEFETIIQDYWRRVQEMYAPYVKEGGVLENKNFYVFQTPYRYQPELMIVGLNPGGEGEDKGGWLSQGQNSYTKGTHEWFQRLRDVFDYPNNKELAEILENCVGTNKYFVNTGSQKGIPKEMNAMGTLLIRELVDIVKPKYLLTLDKDVFCTLKNKPGQCKEFGSVKFQYSEYKSISVGYVYNPSKILNSYFTPDKIKCWNDALKWFLIERGR